MNVFHKVALQGLKKNRTRTAVTIIGVILSTAMFTAVASFGVSLLDYMTNGAAQKYGGWHVGFLEVDSSFIQKQVRSGDVANTVTFENIGYAPLEGGANQSKPYLFVAGFTEETFRALPITLLAGRLPENSREILVSGKIAANAGGPYQVGDIISVSVGSRKNGSEKLNQSDPYTPGGETLVPQAEKTYTVVGLCQTPSFEEDSSPGYTMITKVDTAKTAAGLSLFVTLKHPRQVRSYVGAADNHSTILNNNVLRFMGLSDNPSDRLFNTLLYAAGGIVIAIIMVGSIFLIYNSFSISLSERMRQIGILSSVGATAKQLRDSVLFEGFCIGVVGIPIGILVGLGSIWLVIDLVAKNFGNILYTGVPLTLHLSVLAIVGAAAVSMVTILISAYIPAQKAAATPVMECIRQTNNIKVDPKVVKTSNLSQRIYGLEGTLALKNFKRNKKRYRSIVLSLVLSVVLFISTSAFVMDLKQASKQLKVVTNYDIGFGTQYMDDSEMLQLYDKLKNVDGVSESSYQAFLEYSCTVQADELSDGYWESTGEQPSGGTVHLPMELQFLDDKTYQNIVEDAGLPLEEYTGQNGKLIAVAKLQDNTGQAEGVKQLCDMFISSSMNVMFTPKSNEEYKTKPGQKKNITCIETVPPDTPPTMGAAQQRPYFFQVMAPWSLKETFAPSETKVKGLTFQSETPSQSAAAMKAVIQDTGVSAAYILLNTSELLEESQNYIFIANVFAYTFIIMISLIAIANVFNTISTNIKLRRQELAMLRSVGMSHRDFNKMMRFECAFYGIRALLFGLPLAAVSSWLIYQGMFFGGMDGVDFVLPWSSIGISVLSVLLVIFITMTYATNKIRKENIIDALRDDMA